jgi:RES domain-containing protein
MGAFRNGGRWNNKGTYMLYTSMNSSLAYLENLVHFDESDLPPNLYIAAIEINSDSSIDDLIYELKDSEYPVSWQLHENLENKTFGDGWMLAKKFLAIKVRSAVNPTEFNFLLNPLFPGYHDMIKELSIEPLDVDARLIK